MQVSKIIYQHMVDNQQTFNPKDWSNLADAMCAEFSRPKRKTEHEHHFLFRVLKSEKLRSIYWEAKHD